MSSRWVPLPEELEGEYVVIDLEAMAAEAVRTMLEEVERAELVGAVANGTPASAVHQRIWKRRRYRGS